LVSVETLTIGTAEVEVWADVLVKADVAVTNGARVAVTPLVGLVWAARVIATAVATALPEAELPNGKLHAVILRSKTIVSKTATLFVTIDSPPPQMKQPKNIQFQS
jgi:hypothetical protein